jgi:hypothetical protein
MMNKALKIKNLSIVIIAVLTSIFGYAAPPGGGPPPPTPPPGFPIDGGVVFLLIGAIGFGYFKLRKQRYQIK